MSDHAIWGSIIPIFLKQWLQVSHLKKNFAQEALNDRYGANGSPVEFVCRCMADMALSATVLMGQDAPQADYDDLALVAKKGRDAFNSLCTDGACPPRLVEGRVCLVLPWPQ